MARPRSARVSRKSGVFTLSATPKAGDYFGQTVPPGSNVFGRFTPAGFAAGGTLTNRSDIAACNATPADNTFTYLGEPLSAAMTLNAVNAAGTLTQNYTGSYARLSLAPVSSPASNGLAFGAQSGGTLLNSRLTASCTTCPAFTNGTTTLSAALTVQRATGSTVDGPFYGAGFGLAVSDSDGVGIFGPDYNWDQSGSNEGKSLGTTNLYFGRMRVENAYGSPLLGISVPAYAQYWNGTGFVKSTGDSCTQIPVPASSAITAVTAPALYCNGGVGLYGSLTGVTARINMTSAGWYGNPAIRECRRAALQSDE